MLELGEGASEETEEDREDSLVSHHRVMGGTGLKCGDSGQARVISGGHGLVERIISFCHITHFVTDTSDASAQTKYTSDSTAR